MFIVMFDLLNRVFGSQKRCAMQFAALPEIGVNLPFPHDCSLVADSGYANLQTSQQIRRKAAKLEVKCRKLKNLRPQRIKVENTIVRSLQLYGTIPARL